MNDVVEAIRRHHRELMARFGQHLDAVVNGTAASKPPDVHALREAAAFLRRELLPHARGEEAFLYPAVEPLLRAHGKATATMSADHEAIEQYVRELEQGLAGLEGRAEGERAGPQEDRATLLERLQRSLVQLEAVLRLHLEKEERVYLPLFEAHLESEQQRRIVEGMRAVERRERASHPDGIAGPSDSDHRHPAEPVLDVRQLPPPQRHPLILQTFDELPPGRSLVVVNDHDPRPLNYQFHFERPGQFSWDYLEQGPEVWRVRIGKRERVSET